MDPSRPFPFHLMNRQPTFTHLSSPIRNTSSPALSRTIIAPSSGTTNTSTNTTSTTTNNTTIPALSTSLVSVNSLYSSAQCILSMIGSIGVILLFAGIPQLIYSSSVQLSNLLTFLLGAGLITAMVAGNAFVNYKYRQYRRRHPVCLPRPPPPQRSPTRDSTDKPPRYEDLVKAEGQPPDYPSALAAYPAPSAGVAAYPAPSAGVAAYPAPSAVVTAYPAPGADMMSYPAPGADITAYPSLGANVMGPTAALNNDPPPSYQWLEKIYKWGSRFDLSPPRSLTAAPSSLSNTTTTSGSSSECCEASTSSSGCGGSEGVAVKLSSQGKLNRAFESCSNDSSEMQRTQLPSSRKVSVNSITSEVRLPRVAPVHLLFSRFRRSLSYSSSAGKGGQASPPEEHKGWTNRNAFERASGEGGFVSLPSVGDSCKAEGCLEPGNFSLVLVDSIKDSSSLCENVDMNNTTPSADIFAEAQLGGQLEHNCLSLPSIFYDQIELPETSNFFQSSEPFVGNVDFKIVSSQASFEDFQSLPAPINAQSEGGTSDTVSPTDSERRKATALPKRRRVGIIVHDREHQDTILDLSVSGQAFGDSLKQVEEEPTASSNSTSRPSWWSAGDEDCSAVDVETCSSSLPVREDRRTSASAAGRVDAALRSVPIG